LAAAIEAGREPEDMDVGGILRLVAVTAAIIGVLSMMVFQLVDLESQAVEAMLADTSQQSVLRTTDMQAEEKLTQYGVVDAANGVYRIPIERAIEILAAESRERGPSGNHSQELSGS
jgi:hypothetical protein